MKKATIFLLSFIVILSAYASSKDIKFRHITTDKGLSSNSVRSIIQDKRGYIWIGTEDGLNRYDGSFFQTYRHDPKDSKSIGDNYISCILEAENELWIGTDRGVYVYNYNKDSFGLLGIKNRKGIVYSSLVHSMARDLNGVYWISTNGDGVYMYDKSKRLIVQHELTASFGIIPKVFVDSDNRVWAVSNQGEFTYVYKYNRATRKFDPVKFLYEKPNIDSRTITIYEDSQCNLWLGTWDDGLQKLDPLSGMITLSLPPLKSNGITHIHSICEVEPGKLFIGSDDGLTLFDTKTGECNRYVEDETNPYSLSNKFVYPIFKDNEGGIWIGTYYGGINYITPNNSMFESHTFSKYNNSVGGNVISRFCEDKNNNIWIASDDEGLSCLNHITKEFSHYKADDSKNSLSFNNLHALCIDGDDLWIGTYTGGVSVFNTKTGKFRRYTLLSDNPNSLDGTSSYEIFKDMDNNIWVATMTGINKYNRSRDNFERINLNVLTMDIDQDMKGNLWFSTQGRGVFKYDPKKHIMKNYQHLKDKGFLPSNQVNCMNVCINGDIYAGTMNGLCKYNSSKDIFEDVKLSIPSNNICAIVEDQNALWLTTTQGLVKYVPGERCQVFTKSDGLLCEQFLPNSAFKASDGKIYIGSVRGFNAFYPYQIHINKMIPKVVFSGLEIFNKEVKVGSDILPQELNSLNELVLLHEHNMVSIRYSALSYCVPVKNQYAYMLDGFDKDWNYVGSQNKATYTNLPSGTYVFKVKACNNDGVWNEKGIALKIIVCPPYYLSTPFLVIYIIGCIVAIILLIRFFLKRSEKKHNEEIHILNETKEREMHEAKIQFFTMIAHEIRTPVSLIIAPLEKIMSTSFEFPKIIDDNLNIIDRNSHRLLYLVNQLLDFRKVENEGLKLKCSLCNMNELIAAVSSRFAPTIKQNGSQFIVELPENEFSAIVDSEAITKLISNLLTNANKYTKDFVKLSCSVSMEQHTFLISVTDNGVGISKDDQTKIFKPFYQAADNKPGTGLGLSLVKNIVEAHNGFVEVLSEIGIGSSFNVTLPLERDSDIIDENALEEKYEDLLPEDILQEQVHETGSDKVRILIVDDNKDMLNFLSVSLGERYSILTAEDGIDALSVLKDNDVNLIVSDWMMPRMDGIELCKNVREDSAISHIPFILLTAKSDVNSKIKGMDCGADAYIEKPFSVQYLEACIRNIYDMREQLKQKFSKGPLVPISSIAANSTDDRFLNKMNEIIEENFSNPELSVDFLAERLCISRSGLFAKIKTLANVTPNELIQMIRLKKAAVLLSQKQYRINEICYMVGFNNPSYFSRCFYKQFGMKPGEFVDKQV